MIHKGVILCLFEHANTRKQVCEHSCLLVKVFLKILTHLAQPFSWILNAVNECFDTCLSKQIYKNMSMSILDHLCE